MDSYGKSNSELTFENFDVKHLEGLDIDAQPVLRLEILKSRLSVQVTTRNEYNANICEIS